jgi:hypothetical protein
VPLCSGRQAPPKGDFVGIQVIVESPEGEAAVFSLLDELQSVSEGVASLNLGEQEPGTLGGVVGSVELVLTSGTVVGAVAKVLVTWLRTRQTTTKIRLENKHGEILSVEGENIVAKDDPELLGKILAFFERSSPDEPK